MYAAFSVKHCQKIFHIIGNLNFAVVGIIGVVTTIWFGIGGTIDLFRLFRDLENKEADELDDGRVVGNMSVADAAKMKAAEEAAANEKK